MRCQFRLSAMVDVQVRGPGFQNPLPQTDSWTCLSPSLALTPHEQHNTLEAVDLTFLLSTRTQTRHTTSSGCTRKGEKHDVRKRNFKNVLYCNTLYVSAVSKQNWTHWHDGSIISAEWGKITVWFRNRIIIIYRCVKQVILSTLYSLHLTKFYVLWMSTVK